MRICQQSTQGVKGTKVHPAFCLWAVALCFKGGDEPLLAPIGHLEDHHDLFQYVCDGIAAMKQGLKAWLR